MKKYLVCGFILGLCESCTTYPYLYKPNALNIQVPATSKEFILGAQVGLDGYTAQANYSFNDHLLASSDCSFEYDGKYLNNLVSDFGLGYYGKFGDGALYEISAGGGLGFTNSSVFHTYTKSFLFRSNNEYFDIYSRMYRWSIQASYIGPDEYSSFGYGVRFTNMYFAGEYEALTYDNEFTKLGNRVVIPLNGSSFMIEPGISYHGGIKNIKIVLQAGVSLKLNGIYIAEQYGPLYFPVYFTAGLNFYLYGKLPAD